MCVECGGELSVGRTTRFVTLTTHVYLVVENVPALVCQSCGEGYTDIKTTDTILSLVERVRKALPPGAHATVTYEYEDVRSMAKTA